jgi:hypothetical protein
MIPQTMLIPFLLATLTEYRIAGDDIYRVGQTPTVARIVYSGTQTLSEAPAGHSIRFVARAECKRTDAAGTSPEHARFVQEILPDGSVRDVIDDDPDFLTILNQPFAVQLDAATIHDLRQLRAPVPFAAASPVGGGNLRGMLQPGTPGIIGGRRVIGVRFVAEGAVEGPLPGRAASIDGHIHLDGVAYYDVGQALLLALDARLTIDGTLMTGRLAPVPVRIVYRRAIKSE